MIKKNVLERYDNTYLAHIWRAETSAAMRGFGEIVERQNPEPALLVDETWVCVDLREAMLDLKMLQNGVYEEQIGVADDPEFASQSMGCFNGRNHSRMDRSPFQNLHNVANALPLLLHLFHHPILQTNI